MEAGDGANRFLVIFVAALTGVGGGVLRDLFAGDRPYIFVKHVYACSALLGALVCVYLWPLVGRDIAMLVGFVLVFAMRLCSAHFRWSLPHARRLAEKRRNLLTRGASRSILKEKQKEGNGDETWRGNDLAGSEAGARHAADVYKIFSFQRIGCSYRPGC